MPTRPRSLVRVAQLTERLTRLEAERVNAVQDALVAGARWREIAAALGISSEAARRRYLHLRADPATGLTWREPPLPLGPVPGSR